MNDVVYASIVMHYHVHFFYFFVFSVFFFFFFFFQGEDGILDGRVTGVQTCALPIWRWWRPREEAARRQPRRDRRPEHPGRARPGHRDGRRALDGRRRGAAHPDDRHRGRYRGRSEERSVGKEGRSGWARDHDEENSGQ